MQLPITLELKPSRTLAAALALAHGAVALGAALSGLPPSASAAIYALLAVSLAFNLRRSVFRVPVSALALKADGTLEARERDGSLRIAQADSTTAVFPWLVVLSLKIEGRNVALALPPDALGSEGHRLLRLWLRWKASAAAA